MKKEDKDRVVTATMTTTNDTKRKAREVSRELLGKENISGIFALLINREHKNLGL